MMNQGTRDREFFYFRVDKLFSSAPQKNLTNIFFYIFLSDINVKIYTFAKKILNMKKSLFFLIFILFFIFSVFGQVKVETADYLNYIDRDSIKKTVLDMENFTTRYAPLGNRNVAQYIQQRLVNYGIINTEIDTFYKNLPPSLLDFVPFRGYFYNVRGSILGTNSDSIVIIGAHLDAINHNGSQYVLNKNFTPGADDNASGVAIMIEMARIIHQYNLKTQNRIDFLAFDAEELGLHGAARDAQRRIAEQDKVIIMVNNDMVSNQPIEEEYRINIHWYDNARPEAEYAASVCNEYSSIRPILPQGNDNGMRENSDSWEYAKKGIKSVFFIEYSFDQDYYHTSYDICENYNYEYAEEVGKVNFALLNHYARFNSYPFDIQTVKDRENFSVYPNPVQRMANIAIPTSMYVPSCMIQVFDNYGRICYQTSVIQQRTPIDFSEFASGLYVVQLITPDGHSYSKKIVKI